MYEKITNIAQLKSLAEKDPNAIGVTETGILYVWNGNTNAGEIVTVERASELLDLSLEIIGKIVESRGEYQISIVEPEKVSEEKKPPENIDIDICLLCGVPKSMCVCDLFEEEEDPKSDPKCDCGCKELYENVKKDLADLKQSMESGWKTDRELHSNLADDVRKIKEDFYLK